VHDEWILQLCKNKKNQHKGRRKRMTYAHIISAYRDLQGLHTKYASDMR
jgi:hypothetical protein